MSKLLANTAILALVFSAPVVLANKVTVCEHEGAVREIHVVYEVEGQTVPCTVNYVKNSGTQALWRAENNEGYCEEKADAFIAKQEGWGWTCEAQASADSMMGDAISDSEVVDEMEETAEEVEETMDEAAEEVEEMTESE